MQIILTLDVPDDLVEHAKLANLAEWGATKDKTDEQHVADFVNSLKLTKEHFNLADQTPLNGLYEVGTETVLAHTGTGPSSGARARLLAGLWNALLTVVKE